MYMLVPGLIFYEVGAMTSKESGFDYSLIEEALFLLNRFDHSNSTMKSLFRDVANERDYPRPVRGQLENLVMGTVRFRNTIDFLAARAIGRLRFTDLPESLKNSLRLAIFATRWLRWSITEYKDQTLLTELTDYQAVLERARKMNLDRLIAKLNDANKLGVKYSHPTFIVQTLLEHLPMEEVIQHLRTNNILDEQYLRVNHLLTDDSVMDELDQDSLEIEPDPDIPGLFAVKKGINLIVRSNLFWQGRVLIQDKSSIIAVHALDPRPGETIWDSCAAPGMKTQLILELMNNEGMVIATDIRPARLQMALAGGKIPPDSPVDWVVADASHPPVKYADKILIDAPCSSTGMLQSHPSFKWRLNKKTLLTLMSIQNKILTGIIDHFAEYPGTEIVYSTCSILPHEGESQIDSIMSSRDITLMDVPGVGSPGYSGFACSSRVKRLFPHRHHTNGFFIARFRID